MNIAIEARGLIGARGVRTYILQLLRHLLKQSSADHYEIIHASSKTIGDFPQATNSIVPLSHEFLVPWWLNGAVATHIEKSKPDIIHFTKADVPSRRLEIPSVVTIFDVIPLQLPRTQSFLRRLYWRGALRRAATLSDHIITISEASKGHISQLLEVDPNKITAIPLAVDLEHFKPVVSTTREVPYILFVGRWDERKNILALLQAFAQIKETIPHTLVIAGRPADKPVNLGAIVAKYGITDRVSLQENVSYAQLPALYSGADLFVYPSIIEGWGFPPLEAMACGTPVIVSNGDPLPEVVGDAGEVVPFSATDLNDRLHDTDFVSRLATAMQTILTNPVRLKHMKEVGRMQAQKFSWDAVAQKTLQVYHNLAQ